jgi:hypothetical protein
MFFYNIKNIKCNCSKCDKIEVFIFKSMTYTLRGYSFLHFVQILDR